MKGRRRGSGFRRCFAEIQKRLEWRSRRCARCESWDKQDRQQGWWIIVPSVLRCSEENIRIILTEYNMSAECVLRGRLQRYFCQQVWPESTREFPIHSLHRHFVAARISRNSLKLNLNVLTREHSQQIQTILFQASRDYTWSSDRLQLQYEHFQLFHA